MTRSKILPAISFGLLGVIIIFILADLNFFSGYLGFKSLNRSAQTVNVGNKVSAATDIKNILEIPSLNISAPIIYPATVSEDLFQTDLQKGVVHYPNTANPGQNGNVYIFGHSSDFLWSKGNYKNIFAPLPRIKLGAEINISDSSGNKISYLVLSKSAVSAHYTDVFKQDPTKQILTLQTSYPLGTALARYIVIAELKK